MTPFEPALKDLIEHMPGSSHMVFRTPWPGDPRVNIQNDRGMAKAYQVRQVLQAIDKLKEDRHEH
jgi:hypothetical protein